MMNEKKHLIAKAEYHEIIAIRAIKNHTTMEKELDKILKKDCKPTKKKKGKKR